MKGGLWMPAQLCAVVKALAQQERAQPLAELREEVAQALADPRPPIGLDEAFDSVRKRAEDLYGSKL